jgi:hypothetical protein
MRAQNRLTPSATRAAAPVKILAVPASLPDPVTTLAGETRRLLADRAQPALDPFLDAWPPPAPLRTVTPVSLPVVQWLAAIPLSQPVRHAASPADAPPYGSALIATLRAAAPLLSWRQTYGKGTLPAQFMANYGWTELIGPRGPLPSERFACGFLLLGPDTLYPRHNHEAREFYIPIFGEAEWLQGDAFWRSRAPGTLIDHASQEVHAMQTGAQPLVALYLWQSADLAQSARLAGSSRGRLRKIHSLREF